MKSILATFCVPSCHSPSDPLWPGVWSIPSHQRDRRLQPRNAYDRRPELWQR